MPNKGYKHTEKAKRKISRAGKKRFKNLKEREKISKTLTGRKLSEEHKRKVGIFTKKRFENPKERRKIMGENNGKWKGGIGRERYPPEYLKSRATIRQRDNHTCQLCGKIKQPNGYKLDVHHIDYDRRNSDPKNLITLCGTCNKEVDTNDEKEAWTRFFRRKIKKIYKKLG